MVPMRRQRASEAGCSVVKAPPVDETRGVSIRGRDNADHVEAVWAKAGTSDAPTKLCAEAGMG